MKKYTPQRKIFTLLVFILMLSIGVLVVSAQAPAGSGWWAGFTLQNTNSNNITVVGTAYHETGGAATTYSSSVVVPGSGAVTFNPGLSGNCAAPPNVAANGCRMAFSSDLPAGFEGSVVLSSDGPAVAIAQVNNNPVGTVGVTGGAARGGYQGTGGTIADTTLYFPTVKNNFANQSTAFFVQAAGSDANVTINYKMNNGASFSEAKNIEANKMYVFVPSAAGVPSCNGATGTQCIGGATVTSTTGAVAGTVIEYQEGVSVAKYVLSTRGLVPSDTGTTVIAPTMKNNFFGGTTGASILNADPSSTATVNLSFTVTAVTSGCSASVGDTATDQITVAPGTSEVVSPTKNNIGGLPACTFFAMTATTEGLGNEAIAVTVNESRTSGSNTFKAVYTGFNAANATGTVFFPLVKEDFVNNTTGLAIVNAGSIATTVDVTYSGDTGTHVLRTISLDAGEAVSLRQAYNGSANFSAISGGLPSAGNKYAVSATANATGAVIVGLAQEATVFGTPLDVYNLEGFNQ